MMAHRCSPLVLLMVRSLALQAPTFSPTDFYYITLSFLLRLGLSKARAAKAWAPERPETSSNQPFLPRLLPPPCPSLASFFSNVSSHKIVYFVVLFYFMVVAPNRKLYYRKNIKGSPPIERIPFRFRSPSLPPIPSIFLWIITFIYFIINRLFSEFSHAFFVLGGAVNKGGPRARRNDVDIDLFITINHILFYIIIIFLIVSPFLSLLYVF